MDTFDAGDEIYEFTSSSILSNSSWTTLSMPYTSFTKLGGGTGILDLNRIGAWRVLVTNSGTASNKIFHLDDLRQITTYNSPSSGISALSGSFIQLWNNTGCNCGQWTQTQWENQMQKMKDVCMNKLVIQYGVYGDNAWYSPSSLPYVTYSNPTLARIFAAANAKGIEVYAGLYFDEAWNSADKTLSTTYSSILSKQKQVTDELWSLFSSNASWKGWYIPQEINDLEWQAASSRNLLASYLQSVASYAKGKDNTKKVMVAPFFGPNRPADDLQSWWEAVLTTATDIDMLYPQDGVGTTRADVDTDVPLYFAAIKQACQNKGKMFGATIESFQQTNGWPINTNAFSALPASINPLIAQLREANQHTTDMLQFEWAYMQPSLSGASQVLYNDYKNYVNCTPLNTAIIEATKAKIQNFSSSLYPNPCTAHFILNIPSEIIIKDAVITLYDLVGNEVRVVLVTSNETFINRDKIGSGVYFYTITNNDECIYKGKLIIQ